MLNGWNFYVLRICIQYFSIILSYLVYTCVFYILVVCLARTCALVYFRYFSCERSAGSNASAPKSVGAVFELVNSVVKNCTPCVCCVLFIEAYVWSVPGCLPWYVGRLWLRSLAATLMRCATCSSDSRSVYIHSTFMVSAVMNIL